jgi:hypothetical protein
MRTLIFHLVFVFFSLSIIWKSGDASAQEKPSNSGLWAIDPLLKKAFEEHLDHAHQTFRQVENLEYKAASRLPGDSSKPALLSIAFSQDARYQYDYTSPHTQPAPGFSFISGSDNAFFYKLDRNASYLTIGREMEAGDQTLYMKNYGLLPFLFFPEEYAPDPKHAFLLKPVHLADPLRWVSFRNRLALLGVREILGKKVVVAEIDSGIDFYTQTESRALVYFSIPDGFYPIGWDLIRIKGQSLIMAYRVEEIGTVDVEKAVWQYPQKAIRSYYEDGKLSPTSVASITIDEIKVNQKLPEGRFSIDPSCAARVYDLDTKAYIEVPK